MKHSKAIEHIEFGVASGYGSLLYWANNCGDFKTRAFLRVFAADFYERNWLTALSIVNDRLAGSREQVLLFLDAAWELAVQLEEEGETIAGYVW